MKRIKDIALYSTLTFTFMMMLICALFVVGENTLTGGVSNFSGADFADKAFLLLLYSVFVGVSFLVFDIKPFNQTLKRILHIGLNYGLLVGFIVLFQKANAGANVTANTTMTIFASTFIFIIVYFAAMLISKGINKLGKLIDSANK